MRPSLPIVTLCRHRLVSSNLVEGDSVLAVSLTQASPNVREGTVRVRHACQACPCSLDDRLAVRPYLKLSLRVLHRKQYG
eukprot:1945176-Amphidinium_carterae.1